MVVLVFLYACTKDLSATLRNHFGAIMSANLPEENARLRGSIKDSKLETQLQHLWNLAEKELHPFQRGETSQGFLHCLQVEKHVWSLIHNHIEKFDPRELFILSASAALHDIGKLGSKANKTDHGELGKTFLLRNNNWSRFFEDKVEAKAVANIIGVHCNGNIDTLPEDFVWGDPPHPLLRSLAAIFRLADMLDSDYRRCPYLAYSFTKLKFPEKLKFWIARARITGWLISHDKKRIVLLASPESEKEKIATLAEVDSLNETLTESHKRHLENCRVRYYDADHKTIESTLHFPTACMLPLLSRRCANYSCYYKVYRNIRFWVGCCSIGMNEYVMNAFLKCFRKWHRI